VKEVIHHFFQPLFTSGVSRYKPGLETPLMELGFQLKPTAPDTTLGDEIIMSLSVEAILLMIFGDEDTVQRLGI